MIKIIPRHVKDTKNPSLVGAEEKNSIVQSLLELDLDLITRRNHADELLSNCIKDKFIRTFLIQNLELHENIYRWSINLLAITFTLFNCR